MSTESMNTETSNAVTLAENGGTKTFTQEDVNRIVQDRLAKDRAKTSEEMSKKEQELAQREFRLNSRQKLIERGYPESLLDALNCSNEEAFSKALDALDSLMLERGASPQHMAARKRVPKFTEPSIGRGGGFDAIRGAMGLQKGDIAKGN